MLNQVRVRPREELAQYRTEFIIVLVWRQLLRVDPRDELAILHEMAQLFIFG